MQLCTVVLTVSEICMALYDWYELVHPPGKEQMVIIDPSEFLTVDTATIQTTTL